jgi:hypothetical protein
LRGNQMTHHVHRLWRATDFLDRREVDIFPIRAGGGNAQRPNALRAKRRDRPCAIFSRFSSGMPISMRTGPLGAFIAQSFHKR